MADRLSAPRSWIQAAFDSGIGRPIIPDPIPNLAIEAIPRMLGSQFRIVDRLRGELDDLVRELNDKLTAEDARMRRLLPPAPEGMEWRAELAYNDEYLDPNFSSAMSVRIRYKLERIGGDDG